MVEVSTRAARATDVEEIVALSAALFAEDARARDPFANVGWPGEEGRAHFLRLIRRDDAVCLLAAVEGTIVGYLAGYVEGPTTLRPVRVAELESAYVSEEYRGDGVGTRLVNEFRAWARERGAERMSVTAYASNERAVRFYERAGFRPRNVSLEMAL